MQKAAILWVIAAVFVLMPFASAANAYVLEEFTRENPIHAIVLEPGDIVDFSLMNGTHRLRLKEISRGSKTIKLNVYPFSNEASMAQQVPFFGIDNLVKVDLNKDGEDDVLLDILEIKDGRITLAVAGSGFIAEAQADEALLKQAPEITGAPQGQGLVREQKSYPKTFWAAGIAVIALVIILYVKALNAKKETRRSREDEDEEDEEE